MALEGLRKGAPAVRLDFSITDLMKLKAKLILCAVLGFSALPLLGAESWWEQMDYGRFLSASFNTQSTKGPDGKTIQGKTTLAGDKVGSATNVSISRAISRLPGNATNDRMSPSASPSKAPNSP